MYYIQGECEFVVKAKNLKNRKIAGDSFHFGGYKNLLSKLSKLSLDHILLSHNRPKKLKKISKIRIS